MFIFNHARNFRAILMGYLMWRPDSIESVRAVGKGAVPTVNTICCSEWCQYCLGCPNCVHHYSLYCRNTHPPQYTRERERKKSIEYHVRFFSLSVDSNLLLAVARFANNWLWKLLYRIRHIIFSEMVFVQATVMVSIIHEMQIYSASRKNVCVREGGKECGRVCR